MSKDAMLVCFVCARTLPNVDETADNHPYGGTEFRTYGHYGSTVWDSFYGEELVVNICDDCLRSHPERLAQAQQKRYLPIRCEGMTGFGQQWVDRPMVPYTGSSDTTMVTVEPEELGMPLGSRVEWVEDIQELREHILSGE